MSKGVNDFIDAHTAAPWKSILVQCLLVACFLFGGESADTFSEYFEAQFSQLALSDGLNSGALMFSNELGFSISLLFLGTFLILLTFLYWVATRFDTILASMLLDTRYAERLLIGYQGNIDYRNLTPRECARRVSSLWLALAACIACVLACAGWMFGTMQQQKYLLIGKEGFTAVEGPLKQERRVFPWATATQYRVGCYFYQGSRGNPTHGALSFEVSFKKHTRIDLQNATPVHESWLDAIEIIDKELRALPVPRHDANLEQSPENKEECLSYWRDQLTPTEYARVLVMIEP